MTIDILNDADKEVISQWRYDEQYGGFNYALQKGGWIDSYCCAKESKCFSAKIEDEIIGLFLFIEKSDNEFRILINPSFLNQGYGKALTTKALHVGFNELLYERISLIVRKKHQVAIKLYESLGFEIVAEKTDIVNNEVTEFYKMVKSSL